MTLSMSMMPIIMSTSIIFIFTTHPLAVGVTLLIYTALICITSSLFMSSLWFPYILFLIFLGGMLILFIYITSLAPNESFSMSLTISLFFILSIFFSLSLLFIDPFLKLNIMKTPTSSSNLLYSTSLQILTTKTFYNPPVYNLTLFMIIYLLLTLIVVVKITNFEKGPLQLTNN